MAMTKQAKKLTDAVYGAKLATLSEQIHRMTQNLAHEASWSNIDPELKGAIRRLEGRASTIALEMSNYSHRANREALGDDS